MRTKLPTRRIAENFRVQTGQQRFVCTAGYEFETGSLRELFFNDRGKIGSGLDDMLYDIGVLCSLALQYGADGTDLMRSMCKDADGNLASPVGQALEKALVYEKEHKEALQKVISPHNLGNDKSSYPTE